MLVVAASVADVHGWSVLPLPHEADSLRVLLLPSVSLCRLEFGGGKAPYLAVSDTKIFILGLVLPVALFVKRAHRQHNVGVRIMTGRVPLFVGKPFRLT